MIDLLLRFFSLRSFLIEIFTCWNPSRNYYYKRRIDVAHERFQYNDETQTYAQYKKKTPDDIAFSFYILHTSITTILSSGKKSV